MESFFSSPKTERLSRKVYRTRDEMGADVFDYVERFYNQQPRHSTLDFVSPVQLRRDPTDRQERPGNRGRVRPHCDGPGMRA